MTDLSRFLLVNIFFIFAIGGCATRTFVTDISIHKGFSDFIGKKYRTKLDLLACCYDGSLIRLTRFGERVPSRIEIKDSDFPFTYLGTNVLGVISEGSILEIIRVKKNRKKDFFGVAIFILYIAEIIESQDNDFVGKQVVLGNFSGRYYRDQLKPELKNEWVEKIESKAQ